MLAEKVANKTRRTVLAVCKSHIWGSEKKKQSMIVKNVRKLKIEIFLDVALLC